MFRYTNFRDELISPSSLDTVQNCYKAKAQLDERKWKDLLPFQAGGTMLGGWEGTGIPVLKPGVSFGGLLRGNY